MVIFKLIIAHYRVIKYLIAGGTAAGIDLALLHIFVDWLKWWYLSAAVLAFILALGVSFTLQKFWVFNNRSLATVRRQLILHASLGVLSTTANALLMFGLVTGLGIHYLIAQIIGGGIIAVFNFIIYRQVIFKPESPVVVEL